MAAPATLPVLLDLLTQSLTSALEVTPKLASIKRQDDGVSLLAVKNELLLAYLQNLVFLMILKLRDAKGPNPEDGKADSDLSDAVVKKLVEIRLYLDKGVRPLEVKLRFQLDKILRAVDDADRNRQAQQVSDSGRDNGRKKQEDRSSRAESASGSEEDCEDGVDEDVLKAHPGLKFLSTQAPAGTAAASTGDKTGVYRPPKITPTAMPTMERRQARERRPIKSATMDEYISTELSSAPVAQPSVGTTIVSGGRKVKTATERAEEERRRTYEETNFVRLPKESKKDRAKHSKAVGHNSKMQFGGEDWRDLEGGVDRIGRLTRRNDGTKSSTKVLLEKSRKRVRDTADSARGVSLNENTRDIGERYQKKLRMMEGGRRDRGRR